MDLELVTIGTELLLGFTLDTNGAEIARALAAVGVHAHYARCAIPGAAAATRVWRLNVAP